MANIISHSFAQNEALGVILKHEDIPYSIGVGVGNIIVYSVDEKYVKHVKQAISEWKRAVDGIAIQNGC